MTITKDIVSLLIEEIALEGLDGITIQGLWIRLEDRPDFGLKPLTGKVKPFLWNMIIQLNCIEFYVLPKPRKELKIYEKLSTIDDSGFNVLPEDYEDIYPHVPINDENTGTMGSCKDYSVRIKVTSEAVKCSLDEAFVRWGMELVMVASQEKRRRALLGPDCNPNWELSINEYCMLERIGRGRRHGEITQGPWGLKLINDDNKMLYYYRKSLMRRDIITTQNFTLRIKNNNVSGKAIHLKRFSMLIRSKAEIDADVVIQHLKSKPNMMSLYQDVSKLPIKHDLKKLLKKCQKYFVSDTVPYREMYPDATVAQWKSKGTGGEKNIRVIRFLSDVKDEEVEEKYDEEEESIGLLDESNRFVSVPLMRQSFLLMERSHTAGITQNEIIKRLGVPHLQARSIFKHLKRLKCCGNSMRDVGRQRIGVIHCTKYDTHQSSVANVVANEKSKLLEILSRDKIEKTIFNKPNKPAINEESTVKVLRASKPMSEEPCADHASQTTKIILKKHHVDDEIKTSIVVLQPDIKAARVPSLLDSSVDAGNLSIRLLKRANMILKAVNNLKIIHDSQKLQRLINEEEELEGSNYTVDRKSILRIMEKLELEGHLRRIRVTLTGSFKEKVITFICHPSITPQHSEIQSAIEQAKMKLPIITKDTKTLRNPKALDAIKQLQYDAKVGKLKYGFKPKFIRLRNMHFYLYYLIYNYSGDNNLSIINKKNILIQNNLEPNLLKEMGDIYLDKLDWKMFIPPLPLHEEYGFGWCLVSDILLRLPLFMFLSLVNIPYKIPGIMEYLDHPLKKYYLVKDLPPEISYHLTIMRKYIFTIHDILQQLAYIGLLQFGPQMMKEKDQVFIYLNKNAKLVNTTPSDEGYNHISTDIEYEVKSYHFDSTDSLENYWSDLVKFSMNTKLNNKACVVGKEIVVESVSTKKQILDTLRPRTSKEALEKDVGYIPGDGLGAAGLDSDLFVHLKRNWYWSSTIDTKHEVDEKPVVSKKPPPPKKLKSPKAKKIKLVSCEKIPVEEDEDCKVESDAETSDVKSSKPKSVVQRTPVYENPTFSKRCHRKVTRLMLPAKKQNSRKPYYDQQDKEALKRMKKLRVDWTPKEDNILLLCKVAHVFMCPYSIRKRMKNYSEIREFLHKTLPELSLNKTSRACQRRMVYMMKNPHTAHSVAICIEELSHDKELVAKYGQAAMHRLLTKTHSRKSVTHNNTPGEEFKKNFDKLYLEFINLLLERLKSVKFTKSVIKDDFIPDCIEEFYSKYTVAVPNTKKRFDTYVQKEIEETNDILANVIKTIIHSSLACYLDKTCYSYQLLHAYQQYPDYLLRSVMTECRTCGILASKKNKKITKIKDPTFKSLTLSAAPIKLSNFYMNRLQTKFQYRIFSDSYNFLSCLISQLDSCSQDLETEIFVNNGGECALLNSLHSVGLLDIKITFPEQVIILDPKISETEESFSRVLKRFNDLISHMKSKSDPSKNRGYETDGDDLEDSKDETNYEEFSSTNKNCLASAASRLALYYLRDDPNSDTSDTNLQHAHDYFVINPGKVSISLTSDHIDTLQSLFTNNQSKDDILTDIKKLSSLPSIDRRPEKNTIDSSLDPTSKELLQYVEQGREFGKKTSIVLEMFGDRIVPVINDLINRQLIIRTGAVSLRLVHYSFSKLWVVQSYSLPRSVKDSLAIGNDRVNDLKEMFDDKKDTPSDDVPAQNEDKTTEENQTNTNKRKAENTESDENSDQIRPARKKSKKTLPNVSQDNTVKFSKVVESKNLSDMEVLVKPWIRVDGTLNRRVLDRMLGSVLSHASFLPGLSIEKLQSRFSPAIQPSHLHELVLILNSLGCVKMYKVESKPARSLFSLRSDVVMTEATGLEDPCDIFVEPDPMSIVKLGLFVGDKAYSQIYMDPENFE